MIEEGEWVRYRHKSNRAIEYDVACYSITRGGPISTEFYGETCFRIRTVRNISLPEEVHRPAFTWMPVDRFFDVYEVAAGRPAATSSAPEEETLPESESSPTIKEKKPRRKPGRPISTPTANGEGKKPCTDCGKTKPLSEFAKSAGSKDGHRTECKVCSNQRRKVKPEGKRLCANGEKCVGFRNLRHPAPLTSGNKGEFCFACEEQERNSAKMPTRAAIPGSGAGGRG